MPQPSKTDPLERANTVGIVHDRASLEAASKLRANEVDLLEFRADSFPQNALAQIQALTATGIPILTTARGPSEGGKNNLSFESRKQLYSELLDYSRLIDIELADAMQLNHTATAAKEKDILTVLSFHDFESSRSLDELLAKAASAAEQEADIFKVAMVTDQDSDIKVLENLIRQAPLPVSAMGMGKLGKASRLRLAAAGSCLNYGFLSAANAPGQWPAIELKQRIQNL